MAGWTYFAKARAAFRAVDITDPALREVGKPCFLHA